MIDGAALRAEGTMVFRKCARVRGSTPLLGVKPRRETGHTRPQSWSIMRFALSLRAECRGVLLVNPRPTTLPTLETERLVLRSMQPSDAPALFAIYGDPDVMQYASDEPFPSVETVSVMLASVERLLGAGESLEWAVIEQGTGALVGTCGLHSFDERVSAAEVGCMLARGAWGRGLMREALPALFHYAQAALAVRVVRADIDAANQRSLRLFRQLGFRHAHDTVYERILVPDIVRSPSGDDLLR